MPFAPVRNLDEPPLPSRLPLHDRLRLGADYLWRNNGNLLLRQFRVRWDARGWATLPAIRSEVGGMSITYAGLTEGKAYTLDFTEQRRARSGVAAVRDSRRIAGRDHTRLERLPDSDIVIVGTTAPNARRLPGESSFVLPMRVHFVVDFDEDVEAVLGRIARGERRNFRQKCRQHDWQLSIERDPAWFEYFYDRIYRATMSERHGERQRIESKESAYECLFRNGILFVLSMDGERVGGHLCHWDQKTGVLTSRLLGVVDGAAEHYAAGALKVMHFLLIRWAGENDIRQLDFQGTEAFLSKGTYQLKRLFGTKVVLPPNHFGDKRLWLQVRRDTPEVRDFLVANPFLVVPEDGELEAVYFHDSDRPACTSYKSDSPGVAGQRLIDLDEFFDER
ncbi:GNAT family N-acetyltransferase [Streptomyces sp. NBC_00444]|uniref:GNAT family N-acetyltransferase n=1 Tax=Streptomyces sp. NBC_00444 TaxID=2975744 RepID=UPI002E1A4719